MFTRVCKDCKEEKDFQDFYEINSENHLCSNCYSAYIQKITLNSIMTDDEFNIAISVSCGNISIKKGKNETNRI